MVCGGATGSIFWKQQGRQVPERKQLKLADMLNQLMSQDRYARLTWHRKSEFVDFSCLSRDWFPPQMEAIREHAILWLFTSLPGHVWWGISSFRRLFGCIRVQSSYAMPKLPIRRPGRPTLKVVEGQCQQCFYPQGSTPETLHGLARLLGFCWRNGFGDQEIQTGSEALFSIFARWCGAGSFAWLACISQDNYSKMIILLMVTTLCTSWDWYGNLFCHHLLFAPRRVNELSIHSTMSSSSLQAIQLLIRFPWCWTFKRDEMPVDCEGC